MYKHGVTLEPLDAGRRVRRFDGLGVTFMVALWLLSLAVVMIIGQSVGEARGASRCEQLVKQVETP